MVDEFIKLHLEEKLTVDQAAMAKWWTTEAQVRLVDRCATHGGYGYMREYNVARAFLDARVQTIYGGTTEIMKEIIGRSLGSERCARGHRPLFRFNPGFISIPDSGIGPPACRG